MHSIGQYYCFMRLTSLLIAALIAASCGPCGPVLAQDAVVHVTALRNPASWPYDPFRAGLDAFEEHRHLAPKSELHFHLVPNDPGLALDNVQIVIEHGDQRLVLDAEKTSFVLPRLTRYDPDDAVLSVNKHQDLFDQHWPTAAVRTPGLSSHVLRIGDLRLACQVNMAILKKNLGFWESAALSVMAGQRDWCVVGRHGGQSVRAPFAFQAVTFHDGDRTERRTWPTPQLSLSLPSDQHGWSDGTLIEFDAVPAN
ncbi:hypothetical protein [Pseudoduganella sp. R-43]|uniref:hypothetical protein n=1 Tax=unclassified Pseudoduganella TaxID=2637179 RepID=UPI003CE76CD6